MLRFAWCVPVLVGVAGLLAFLPPSLSRREPAPEKFSPRPWIERLPERANDALALAQAQEYDALLNRQDRDPVQQDLLEARARQAFLRAESQGIHLERTECGQTLCRLEIQLEDIAARQAFDRVASRLLENGGEGFAYLENEDDLDIEVYVSRDGSLPPHQNR
jgi:hypothetical protein